MNEPTDALTAAHNWLNDALDLTDAVPTDIIRGLVAELEKAAKFKDWTHSFLDGKGVPADPDPEGNKEHGCRISGRMKWVFDELERLRTCSVARDDGLCCFCNQQTDSFAGNPAKWAVRIGAAKLCHVGCVNERFAELKRLRADERLLVDLFRSPKFDAEGRQGDHDKLRPAQTAVRVLKRLIGHAEEQSAEEWAETHTALQQLVRRHIPTANADGDEHGVPGIGDLLAMVDGELERLRGVIAQHDLCHDLHGKVNARAFADGCAAEQRKLYGCAPDADELAKLRELGDRLVLSGTMLNEYAGDPAAKDEPNYEDWCNKFMATADDWKKAREK